MEERFDDDQRLIIQVLCRRKGRKIRAMRQNKSQEKRRVESLRGAGFESLKIRAVD